MAINTPPPIGQFPGAQQRFGFVGSTPSRGSGAYGGGGYGGPGGTWLMRQRRPTSALGRLAMLRALSGDIQTEDKPYMGDGDGGSVPPPPPPGGGTGGGLIGTRDPSNPKPPIIGNQPYIPPTPGSGYTPGGATGGEIGTEGGSGGGIPGVPGWPGDNPIGGGPGGMGPRQLIDYRGLPGLFRGFQDSFARSTIPGRRRIDMDPGQYGQGLQYKDPGMLRQLSDRTVALLGARRGLGGRVPGVRQGAAEGYPGLLTEEMRRRLFGIL